MKFNGKLSIGKPMGGYDPNTEFVHITIEDEASTCRFCEIKISLEEFGRALFSLALRPCTVDFFEKAPLGMKREVKHEDVENPHDRPFNEAKREALERTLVAPFEIDGWRASRPDDLWNGHNRIKHTSIYRIAFDRYVNPATGEPILR